VGLSLPEDQAWVDALPVAAGSFLDETLGAGGNRIRHQVQLAHGASRHDRGESCAVLRRKHTGPERSGGTFVA
jgi:hypothetical protein